MMVVVGLVGVIGTLWMLYGRDGVRFSEDFARHQVSKRLPIEKTGSYLGIGYVAIVDGITFDFVDGDLIDARVFGRIGIGERFATFSLAVVGTPELKDGAFYFRPDSFEFGKITFSEKLEREGEAAGTVASNVIRKYAGDLLQGSGIRTDRESIIGKVKAKAKETTENLVIRHFNRYPVKRLETGKEALIGLAVRDVTIDDDALTIRLSFWNLAWHVFLFAGCCVIAFGFLVTAPHWAVGLVFFSGLFGFE